MVPVTERTATIRQMESPADLKGMHFLLAPLETRTIPGVSL